MGATTIFCFSCETNILHIISRFYVGIVGKTLLAITTYVTRSQVNTVE